MTYNANKKNATMKYLKDKTQQIVVRYKKDEYDSRIKPAIDASGMPQSTFIKQAIDEKIERDGLSGKEV